MVKQKKGEGRVVKQKKGEGRVVKQKKEVMLRPPVVHVPRHFPCIRFPPHSLSPVMSISPFIHV